MIYILTSGPTQRHHMYHTVGMIDIIPNLICVQYEPLYILTIGPTIYSTPGSGTQGQLYYEVRCAGLGKYHIKHTLYQI